MPFQVASSEQGMEEKPEGLRVAQPVGHDGGPQMVRDLWQPYVYRHKMHALVCLNILWRMHTAYLSIYLSIYLNVYTYISTCVINQTHAHTCLHYTFFMFIYIYIHVYTYMCIH